MLSITLDPPSKRDALTFPVIQRFEHGILKIGDEGFKHTHWEALVKLNTQHGDRYFRVLHNGVQFKQYVGVIQVGKLTLEILPKADRDDTDERWQGVLIEMLRSCKRLRPHAYEDANLNPQPIRLLDLYFEEFLRETESLVRLGLVKRYRKEAGNVKALKGKLDFAGNIRHNLVHKERFYTVHQVYDVNHLLHQVLACALDITDLFTSGSMLGDLCKRVRLGFPDVDRIRPSLQLLDTVKLNRKTSAYKRAYELARLIILNYSPDVSSGKEKMISLLFDMNRLWEEYIRVKLAEYVHKRPELSLEFVSGSATFWGSHNLRPDMILRSGGKTLIIDTKWKRPDRPSIQDLRQMYAYARFWKAERVMLLYPGKQADSEHGMFGTDDYWLDESVDGMIEVKGRHCCTTGFVSVLRGAGELDDEIAENVMKLVGHID